MIKKKIILVDQVNTVRDYTVPLILSLKKLYHDVVLVNSPSILENHTHHDFEINLFGYKFQSHLISIKFLKNILNFFFYIFGWIKLTRYCVLNNPDIIHFQASRIPIIDLCFKNFISFMLPRAKLVLTIHNSNHLHGEGIFLRRIMIKNYHKSFNNFFLHSNETKSYLDTIKIKKKYSYFISKIPIYNYFKSYKSHKPTINKIKEISEKLTNKKVKFLFFGLIRNYKGIDILLDAISKIPNKNNFQVIIAGKPDKNIKLLMKQAENLQINKLIVWDLNWIEPEKANFYFDNADIIILPYRKIDGSGVVSTALSYKKPMILSRIKGFEEIIDHYEDGFLFESENSDHLAELMNTIIIEPKVIEKIKHGLVKKINEWPSWEEVSLAHKNLYEIEDCK